MSLVQLFLMFRSTHTMSATWLSRWEDTKVNLKGRGYLNSAVDQTELIDQQHVAHFPESLKKLAADDIAL